MAGAWRGGDDEPDNQGHSLSAAVRRARPEGSATLLDDAAHRAWAARVLGALWLIGAACFLLLFTLDHRAHDIEVMLTGWAAVAGIVLLTGWPARMAGWTFDALLIAMSTAIGAAAYALPRERATLALCWVWVIPFAFALLPPRRALLQAGYGVLLYAAVVAVGSGATGGAEPRPGVADAVRWLFVALTVAAVGLVVWRLSVVLRGRAVVAEAVAELGHRALTVAEPDELLREALRVAVDVLKSEYGTALRRLPDGQLRVALELGPEPLPPGTILPLAPLRSYALHIVNSGLPFASTDLRRDSRVTPPTPLIDRGVVSGLAVPVLGSYGTLGVLAVHSRRRRRFAHDEVVAATALASVVATAWEQVAQRELMSHQAMHDPLTGLPNRSLFLNRLEQALTRRTGSDSSVAPRVAVMLIDLDDFKTVNDSLGHAAGDELLVAAARRFSAAVRPQDTIARFGGDEFALLCDDVADERTVTVLAERLLAASADPLPVEGTGVTVTVTASIGIALAWWPERRTVSREILLREADVGLYRAKDLGRGGFALFDQRLQVRTRARVQFESELRRAIERHELVLHYQPIRSVIDERVRGVEALVRWDHPRRGLLAPSEFVPVAEQSGLIVPLGRWVLREACEQAARWQRGGRQPPSLWVSVNVSPRQLDDGELPDEVTAVLRDTALAEGTLMLELTETALPDRGEAGVAALTRLRAAGAHLVLDDFGTGYSSLAHLTNFPIEAMKVDRSFVAGLNENRRDASIVSAVIALGGELGVDVIAEGVETQEQLSMLRKMGCQGVQGFLLDRPSPSPSLGDPS